ncbi:hypothetical protein PRIPAC_93318, partial [Pristionchus pacificus]
MMNLSNEFTLAFLPTDIIWTIFSCMDPGKEKLNNVRLISKTWNLLAVEHIKRLPRIEILSFHVRGDEIEVNITVDKNHTNHFAKLHPMCSIDCTRK